MKITVVGAGGIGGYLGTMLSAAGEEVTFVARHRNLEAINARGFRLRREDGTEVHAPRVRAVQDPADAGPQDVHETAPRTVAVVNGTAFPLDPRRQYTVDLHAPAGEMEFVEQLARATMCYRTPACSVAFVGPRADGLVAAVRR